MVVTAALPTLRGKRGCAVPLAPPQGGVGGCREGVCWSSDLTALCVPCSRLPPELRSSRACLLAQRVPGSEPHLPSRYVGLRAAGRGWEATEKCDGVTGAPGPWIGLAGPQCPADVRPRSKVHERGRRR